MVLPQPIGVCLLPFLIAGGATGLLCDKGGPRALAGPAVGAAMAAAFMAANGAPFFGAPPHHALGESLVLFTVAGAAISVFGDGIARWHVIVLWAALAAAVWPFGIAGFETPDPGDMLQMAIAAGCGCLALWRLTSLSQDGPAGVGVAAVAAAGLAAVAGFARSGVTAGLALSLACACLGWLVWAWRARRGATAIATLVAGTSIISIGVEVTRTALHAPWALLVLFFCCWPEAVVARVPPLAKLARRKAYRPTALVLAAAPPAVLAGVLAFVASLGRTAP
ncbi:MAG TPA: hypothetical protein VKS60_10205 [Stellaceae bacterium]|nr:hypothetical protein [Stellaceae bacterium]